MEGRASGVSEAWGRAQAKVRHNGRVQCSKRKVWCKREGPWVGFSTLSSCTRPSSFSIRRCPAEEPPTCDPLLTLLALQGSLRSLSLSLDFFSFLPPERGALTHLHLGEVRGGAGLGHPVLVLHLLHVGVRGDLRAGGGRDGTKEKRAAIESHKSF